MINPQPLKNKFCKKGCIEDTNCCCSYGDENKHFDVEDVKSAVEYRKQWFLLIYEEGCEEPCTRCSQTHQFLFGHRKEGDIQLCSVCVEEHCYPDLFEVKK